MGYPRHLNVPPDVPGTYHCVSRCVRRAFLCGQDQQTGRSFDHRKQWLEDRILELGNIFAVAIHGYAVMSNHFHLVIETDPLHPDSWSDAQIATRWLALTRKGSDSATLLAKMIDNLVSQPERIQTLRSRLGSLSWFMRYLKEPIARQANREDECTGRFWEGRFRTQSLLDDASVLSSMVYVDLNPLRANAAQTLKTSKHTSIRRRIEEIDKHHHQVMRPLATSIDSRLFTGTFDHYLELVDWSAHKLHNKGDKVMGSGTPSLLKHLHMRETQWLIQVPATESEFWRAIGSAESLLALARTRGRRWIRGLGTARHLQQAAIST